MSEHQFCVGDLVNLRASMSIRSQPGRFYNVLIEAYQNGPHRIIAINQFGGIQIDAQGLESAFFRREWLKPAIERITPIDDLI